MQKVNAARALGWLKASLFLPILILTGCAPSSVQDQRLIEAVRFLLEPIKNVEIKKLLGEDQIYNKQVASCLYPGLQPSNPFLRQRWEENQEKVKQKWGNIESIGNPVLQGNSLFFQVKSLDSSSPSVVRVILRKNPNLSASSDSPGYRVGFEIGRSLGAALFGGASIPAFWMDYCVDYNFGSNDKSVQFIRLLHSLKEDLERDPLSYASTKTSSSPETEQPTGTQPTVQHQAAPVQEDRKSANAIEAFTNNAMNVVREFIVALSQAELERANHILAYPYFDSLALAKVDEKVKAKASVVKLTIGQVVSPGPLTPFAVIELVYDFGGGSRVVRLPVFSMENRFVVLNAPVFGTVSPTVGMMLGVGELPQQVNSFLAEYLQFLGL